MPAPKSIDQPEYALVLDLIRQVRIEAGLSQQALAERLDRPQTYASDCELGARRMDVLQLLQWCVACDTTLADFAERLESALAADEGERPEKPPQRAPRKQLR